MVHVGNLSKTVGGNLLNHLQIMKMVQQSEMNSRSRTTRATWEELHAEENIHQRIAAAILQFFFQHDLY